MSDLELRILNAREALDELQSFFYRHELYYWPGILGPIAALLQDGQCLEALMAWRQVPLLSEQGLMEVRVCYEAGFRISDAEAEQRHFELLLEQSLATMNNLRLYVDVGVVRPVLSLRRDMR